MSTSNEEPAPGEQSTLRFDTNVQGSVQQLIQIAQVQGSINFFSQDVINKLFEAIAAQGRTVDNSLQMRKAVAYTLALLRSKNALYASLDNEIWEYVFKSLRELRDALAQASGNLHIDGPRNISSLLDLMVVAIRDYVAKYETKYILFTQSRKQDLSTASRGLGWPELRYAARDLLSLRSLLIAAIAPLNAYVEEGVAVHWDQKDFMGRKWEMTSVNEPFDHTPLQTRDASTTAALIHSLKDKEFWVRWSAADALFRNAGPASISAWVEALADEEPYIRRRAVAALQRIGGPAIPALANFLKKPDNKEEAYYAAVEALGKIGGPAAIPALTNALSDTDWSVRNSAWLALRNLQHP